MPASRSAREGAASRTSAAATGRESTASASTSRRSLRDGARIELGPVSMVFRVLDPVETDSRDT